MPEMCSQDGSVHADGSFPSALPFTRVGRYVPSIHLERVSACELVRPLSPKSRRETGSSRRMLSQGAYTW